MSEPTRTARLELESLTYLQELLHSPESASEVMPTRFPTAFTKISASYDFLEELKAETNGNAISYKASSRFDWLVYTYTTQVLPPLEVDPLYQDRVQICWPHNIGHNIFSQGQLWLGEEDAGSFDNIYHDMYGQYIGPRPGFRDHYNVMVGNIPILQEWGASLPKYELVTPMPWYYCRSDPRSFNDPRAIPLFLSTGCKVAHELARRIEIRQLVRMRARKSPDKEWEVIPYNWKYIRGAKEGDKMPDPRMWGKYSHMTDSERKWHMTFPHDVFTEAVLAVDEENLHAHGSNVDMVLSSDFPVKMVMWVGENDKARRLNNYSNYTTNGEDLFAGWGNISKAGLKLRNGAQRIPYLSHVHFSLAEPFYRAPSAPAEPGYSMVSFGRNILSFNADSTATLREARLTLRLKDTTPRTYPKDDAPEDDKIGIPRELLRGQTREEEAEKNVRLRIRMLVMRRLRFPVTVGKPEFVDAVVAPPQTV